MSLAVNVRRWDAASEPVGRLITFKSRPRLRQRQLQVLGNEYWGEFFVMGAGIGPCFAVSPASLQPKPIIWAVSFDVCVWAPQASSALNLVDWTKTKPY